MRENRRPEVAVPIPAPFSQLARRFPRQRLLADPAELFVYECDALPVHRQPPAAVALCESRDEVVT